MRRSLIGNVESMESRALMSAGLTMSMTVNKPSTVSGQAVVFTFTETNRGKSTVKVPDDPNINGFVVTEANQAVWKSNVGPQSFIIPMKTLKPGQSLSISETWDGRSNLVDPSNPNDQGPLLTGTFSVAREQGPNGPSSTFNITPLPVSSTPRPSLTPPPAPTPTSQPTYTITTDQTSYKPGQATKLTFTETNTTDQPVSFDFGPSIDGFVVQKNGQTIWSSNSGAQPFFIASTTLQPGESHSITATWDGNGLDQSTGAETSPVSGTFTIFNQLQPGTMVTISRSAS